MFQANFVNSGQLVPSPIEPLVQYVQNCFPSARLFDSHQGYAHMQVPDPSVKLADVFEVSIKLFKFVSEILRF